MSSSEEKQEQLGVGYEEQGGEEEYEGAEGEGEGEEEGYEDEDAKLEEMKRRVEEMEQEAAKLSKMQQQVKREMSSAADSIDEHSIYVGQVDYEATPAELQAHFAPCGTINRVTIICDKYTGHSKGYAYVEFADIDSVENALKLNDSIFKGRQLKVLPKRHNVPSALRGRGRGRGRAGRYPSGRGYRGGRRGGYRGGYRGGPGGYTPY